MDAIRASMLSAVGIISRMETIAESCSRRNESHSQNN